jgi:mRNA interferase MazF
VKRGELYRVAHPSATDPKKFRVFVVVSRQVVIESRFSTVICAPVYSVHDGLSTQVPVGMDEGLKHDSSIHCDELVSLPKSALTDFIGTLSPQKIQALNNSVLLWIFKINVILWIE